MTAPFELVREPGERVADEAGSATTSERGASMLLEQQGATNARRMQLPASGPPRVSGHAAPDHTTSVRRPRLARACAPAKSLIFVLERTPDEGEFLAIQRALSEAEVVVVCASPSPFTEPLGAGLPARLVVAASGTSREELRRLGAQVATGDILAFHDQRRRGVCAGAATLPSSPHAEAALRLYRPAGDPEPASDDHAAHA